MVRPVVRVRENLSRGERLLPDIEEIPQREVLCHGALEVKLDEPRGRVGFRVRMEGLYAARRDADVSRDRVAASQDIDSEERVEMEDFRRDARIPCEGAGRIEVRGGPHRPGPDDEDSRDNGHMPPAEPEWRGGPAGGVHPPPPPLPPPPPP